MIQIIIIFFCLDKGTSYRRIRQLQKGLIRFQIEKASALFNVRKCLVGNWPLSDTQYFCKHI